MSAVPASIKHVEEEETAAEQKAYPGKFQRKEERYLEI